MFSPLRSRSSWAPVISLLALVCFVSGCQRKSSDAAVDKPDPPAATEPQPPIESRVVANVLADDESVSNRPIQKPHDGYVSSSACLECHPNEHESWTHSYHRTMTQLVSDESVVGGFEGKSQEIYGWKFTTEKRGDDYWGIIKSMTGSANHEYQLVMSTGSHHMQKYWYHTGKSRKMGMLPMIYLIEADKWLPEKSAFLSPPQTSLGMREGAWNTGCNQCHATGAHPRITGANEMDTLVAEFGISCEACHGPGEKHVREKTADSIVNPRELSSVKSAQVCGQCHGAWIRTDRDTAAAWSQTGNAYRPGDDLFETRYYPHGSKDKSLHEKIHAVESFWPDGENRVAGREMNGLLASPCHSHELGDEQRMSCISCHDLHTSNDDKKSWANDQMGDGMYGNEACLQCHESFREKVVEHTHHAADSSGSLCYNCHMPYTSYGLLKAVRTHTVGSPSAQTTLDTGKINACNQCHLDQTLEWTAQNLTSMYGHAEVELPSDHKKIAASVLWTVKGDAAQRALMAWSMGWEDAQKVSGDSWTVFYLADLMFDDYDAIRYIAYRSLKSMPGFESIEYDHMRPQEERERVMKEVLTTWNAITKERPTAEKLLYDSKGEIQYPTYQSLRQLRDNRPILVTE